MIEQIYQLLPVEDKLYFYRTSAGEEADLILVKGIKPMSCIEIKYSSSSKVSKGLMSVIVGLETEKNYILTPTSDTYSLNPKVSVINLVNFLTLQLSELAEN